MLWVGISTVWKYFGTSCSRGFGTIPLSLWPKYQLMSLKLQKHINLSLAWGSKQIFRYQGHSWYNSKGPSNVAKTYLPYNATLHKEQEYTRVYGLGLGVSSVFEILFSKTRGFGMTPDTIFNTQYMHMRFTCNFLETFSGSRSMVIFLFIF